MRIVETDNFGRDCPNERFVLFSMPEEDAKAIADLINKASAPKGLVEKFPTQGEQIEKWYQGGTRFWKVVDNDYKLDRSTPV